MCSLRRYEESRYEVWNKSLEEDRGPSHESEVVG